MRSMGWSVLGWMMGALGLMACGDHVGPSSTSDVELAVDIDVFSDPGKGLPGVALRRGAESVAVTDAGGHAKLTLSGEEGLSISIAVECPSGYSSPSEPILVALRRPSTNARQPRFEARCAPQTRTAVIGIRADNGADLPVMVLGKEIARTDASGAALVVLPVRPSENVAITLDTKGVTGVRLRPESPTLTYVAKDRDEVVVLEQRFSTEKLPRRASGARPIAGPTRM